MLIRPERPADVDAIRRLIDSAFLGMPYADGDEADLVEALRAHDALALSLVAEEEGVIVGQVAFSPARTSSNDPGWYTLGPLAVLPDHQRRGIGAELVRKGLEGLLGLGARGCILTGNPTYYARFGFSASPENAPPQEAAEFFMVKVLRGDPPAGPIRFHEVFTGAV